MINVIPVTQARKDLLRLVDRVDREYTRFDLTKKGRVKAVLVSPEYLDAIEETIYSIDHSLKDIKKAEKQISRSQYVTLEQFKKQLKIRNAR